MEASALTALVLFFKRPRRNYSKQRIARTLGCEATLELANGLLNCALEDVSAWPGARVLAPAQTLESEWAATLLRGDYLVEPQGEGNLGARIQRVDQALRQQGFTNILIIGSDAPLLNQALLATAADALQEKDLVFSPARDGGVTLMGSRVGWQQLETMPWSASTLAHALIESAASQSRSIALLEETYDIDLEEDLYRLQGDLTGDERASRRHLYDLLVRILKNTEVANSVCRTMPVRSL